MSVTHEVTIWCDGKDDSGHDCTEWRQGSDGVVALRIQLNNQGWSVRGRGKKDLCPECVKEGQQ